MIINNELLAAYVEGNVSQEEREAVRQYMAVNPNVMESVLFAMDNVNDEYINNLMKLTDEIKILNSSSYIPMTAIAAHNTVDNLCAIRCEGFALRHFGYMVSDEQLLKESKDGGWLKNEGMALHNIGRLSGERGLSVSHRYHSNIKEIRAELSNGNILIAAVDGNELIGNYIAEKEKDLSQGNTPNHVVIINKISNDTITLTDSATSSMNDVYQLSQFIDAWNDSLNYLIIISNSSDYTPHPIDLNDVVVENELLELREAMAENAHEVWAESRKKDGWTYGPVRNDETKQHPDLVPYNLLSESEKEYDRNMAMNTIKLVKKLGWELRKQGK